MPGKWGPGTQLTTALSLLSLIQSNLDGEFYKIVWYQIHQIHNKIVKLDMLKVAEVFSSFISDHQICFSLRIIIFVSDPI